MATASRTTGLTFVEEGPTDEEPTPECGAQLARYGGDTVGLAGSQAYPDCRAQRLRQR